MAEVIKFGEDDDQERDPELQKLEQEIGTDEEVASKELERPEFLRSAMNLRFAGATFAEIAETLGYVSPAVARMAVEKAIAAAAVDDSDRKTMRQQMSMVLDQYHKAIYPKAIDKNHPDQLAYLNAALKITDRKIKLHGVDAPQVHFVNPEADDLERWVEAVAKAGGYQEVQEADPFADAVDMVQDPETGEWSEAPGDD